MNYTTSEEAAKIILDNANDELRDEIMRVVDESEDWEEQYNVLEAFDWVFEVLIDGNPDWKHLQKPCMKVFVALGLYKPMSKEELDSWKCVGTSKNKSFPKYNGIHHIWDAPSNWSEI